MPSTPDLAQLRFQNAMALFDEFVSNTVKHPDAATLRGLEGRFAQKLQLQPSYWSQIKGRSRQIGERLARQFEQLCHKPHGWMDQLHSASTVSMPPNAAPIAANNESPGPQDDDERFIVGLVLTYYRRHPQRARTRLLDLLGEVLTPATGPTVTPTSKAKNAPVPPGRSTGPAPAAPVDDAHALWMRSQASVAPLKQKK